MYKGEVPLLTRGSFSKFYGGYQLVSSLSIKPKPLSSVYPIGMGVILVYQILLILLKRKQLNSWKLLEFKTEQIQILTKLFSKTSCCLVLTTCTHYQVFWYSQVVSGRGQFCITQPFKSTLTLSQQTIISIYQGTLLALPVSYLE